MLNGYSPQLARRNSNGGVQGTLILKSPVIVSANSKSRLTGRGTPAPIAPLQHLVVVGFYRYLRNPMYVGFALGWIGLWIVFGHANLLAIAAFTAVALAVYLFVILYEEPTLCRKFGAQYELDCRNVRWWPRTKGWDKPE